MAEIEKHIEIDGYRFTLTLRSKDDKAHSFMTDKKELLVGWMLNFTTKLNEILPESIKVHKESKIGGGL